ncbi:MAG: penicillin acylase family protein [Pseudomonadota bacterium]
MRSSCVIVAVALAVAALSCGGGGGAWIKYRVTPDYPKAVEETLDLPGLDGPVTIYFDPWGVPHIDAGNETDLLRAVGFVHGRDRFFQMDMLRRMARGRLSELLGAQPAGHGTTVEVDRTMRMWGMDADADADEATMSPELKVLMEAYCDGVNQAVALRLPLEYRLLRAAPAPWRPGDSFAVGRLLAFGLSHNWKQELYRFLMALEGGARRADVLYPSEALDFAGDAATLPGRDPDKVLPPALAPELLEYLDTLASPPPSGHRVADAGFGFEGLYGGSNAWVVGGDHTQSGKPILANDPHMTHLLPSLMVQQHIRCPGLHAIGVTAPGLPYVLIGHNDRVAWGNTTAVSDAQDLYVEKPAGDGAVLTPEGPLPLQTAEIVITVRKNKRKRTEHRFTLRTSRHGPLLNDLYPELLPPGAPLVAVRWETTGAGLTVASVRKANKAATAAAFREAMQAMSTPVQNVVVADVDGAVGFFRWGRAAIRRNHRGTFPAPGWLAKYDWARMAEAEEMATAEAGPEGIFVTGNNLARDPRYGGEVFQIDAAPPYRVQRIRQLLRSAGRHTAGDHMGFHRDTKLLRAKRFMPGIIEDLRGMDDLDDVETEALRILENWNFDAGPEDPAPAIFFSLVREAGLTGLRDELSDAGLQFVLTLPYPYATWDHWFTRVDHPGWDDRGTPEVETRTDVVREAFRTVVGELRLAQGEQPHEWAWGQLHSFLVRHPFGRKKALRRLNLPRVPAGGGWDSIWKTHFALSDPDDPFRTEAGPVYRQVIDLADIHHAHWILDTGASGWPDSPHYRDQYALWREGEYVPMTSDWDLIPGAAEAILTLEPTEAAPAPGGAGR